MTTPTMNNILDGVSVTTQDSNHWRPTMSLITAEELRDTVVSQTIYIRKLEGSLFTVQMELQRMKATLGEALTTCKAFAQDQERARVQFEDLLKTCDARANVIRDLSSQVTELADELEKVKAPKAPRTKK